MKSSFLWRGGLTVCLGVLAACGGSAKSQSAASPESKTEQVDGPAFWGSFHKGCEEACLQAKGTDKPTCSTLCDCNATRLGEKTLQGDALSDFVMRLTHEDPIVMSQVEEAANKCVEDFGAGRLKAAK